MCLKCYIRHITSVRVGVEGAERESNTNKKYKANVKVLKAILLEILYVIAELIMFRYIE